MIGFFGRPPLAPFRRAAVALAPDVTRPPLRPRATAAGFLRDMGKQRGITRHGESLKGRDTIAELTGGKAVHLSASTLRSSQHEAQASSVLGVLRAELIGREL